MSSENIQYTSTTQVLPAWIRYQQYQPSNSMNSCSRLNHNYAVVSEPSGSTHKRHIRFRISSKGFVLSIDTHSFVGEQTSYWHNSEFSSYSEVCFQYMMLVETQYFTLTVFHTEGFQWAKKRITCYTLPGERRARLDCRAAAARSGFCASAPAFLKVTVKNTR